MECDDNLASVLQIAIWTSLLEIWSGHILGKVSDKTNFTSILSFSSLHVRLTETNSSSFFFTRFQAKFSLEWMGNKIDKILGPEQVMHHFIKTNVDVGPRQQWVWIWMESQEFIFGYKVGTKVTKFQSHVTPFRKKYPVNIAVVERSTEMSMLGSQRRLFVSHSHDNYLLASELGFHGTISTSRRPKEC